MGRRYNDAHGPPAAKASEGGRRWPSRFPITEGWAEAAAALQVPEQDTTVAHRLLPLLVASFLASALPAAEADSAPAISADRVKAGVAYLASDRLEGRGPGTRGEILAT